MNYPPIPPIKEGEKVIADIWSCGDECYCTQARVYVLVPYKFGNGTAWSERVVWEGTYHSEATTHESNEQLRELIAACAHYGLEAPKT